MPDVLKTGKLNEQLNYIEERTRIYEYYRAIREDMWQQIKKNTLDTLTVAKGEISTLTLSQNKFNSRIDSLNKLVRDARANLDEAVRTKNNIKVLGLDINKFAYNSVMWIILASLSAILAIGFLVFKRNIAVTRNTKKDLEELKTEFETYRKQSREAREKMSMEHFNEVRRLKARSGERRAESGEHRAQVEERGLTNEVRKSRKAGDEIPQSGSEEPGYQVEESEVQLPQSGGEGEVQQAQIEELRADGEEGKIQSAARKPRRRKTQNPGQGSIEL
jgi:uncharacterized membrane-anchored protein YhcB (DUF1043 family)